MHVSSEGSVLKAPFVCLCLALLFNHPILAENQVADSHDAAFVEFSQTLEALAKEETESASGDANGNAPIAGHASKEDVEALEEALQSLAEAEAEYGKDSLGSLGSLSGLAESYLNTRDPKCLEYVTRSYKAIAAIIKQVGSEKIGALQDNRYLFIRPMTTEIYYHYFSGRDRLKGRSTASEMLKLAAEMSQSGQSVDSVVYSVSDIAIKAGDTELLQMCISTSKQILDNPKIATSDRDGLAQVMPALEQHLQNLNTISSLRGKNVSEILAYVASQTKDTQTSDGAANGQDSIDTEYEAAPESLPKSIREGIKLRKKIISSAQEGRGTGLDPTYVDLTINEADSDFTKLIGICERYINTGSYAKAEAMFPIMQQLISEFPPSDQRLAFAQRIFLTEFSYYLSIRNKAKAEEVVKSADRLLQESRRSQNEEDTWNLAFLVQSSRANLAVMAGNPEGIDEVASAIAGDAQSYVRHGGGLGTDAIRLTIAACYLEGGEIGKALSLYRATYPSTLQKAIKSRDRKFDPNVFAADTLQTFIDSYQATVGNYMECARGLLQAAQLSGSWEDAFKVEREMQDFIGSLGLPADVLQDEVPLQKLFALNDLKRGDGDAALARLNNILKLEEEKLGGALSLPQQDLLSWQRQYYDLDLSASLLDPDELFELNLRRKGLATEVLLQRSKIATTALNAGDASMIAQLKSLQAAVAEETRLPLSQRNAERLAALEKETRDLERKLASKANVSLILENQSANTLDAVLSSLAKGECLVDFLVVRRIVEGRREPAHYEALIIGAPSEEPNFLAQGIKAVTDMVTSTGESDRVKRVKLGQAEQLDEQISAYRAAIASGDATRTETLGKALYETLWKPVENALPNGARSVLISPEKSVSFVPFAALNAPDGKFVGESFNVAYLGSARDLLRPSTQREAKSLVAFANPVFDASSEGETTEESRVISGQASLFGQIELPPLPGTQAEADALAVVASDAGWRADSFVGGQATEEQLRKVVAPSILHLATHGFYLNSFLPPSVGTRGMSVVATGTSSKSADSAGVDPMLASGVALTGAQQAFRAWSAGRSTDEKSDGVLTAQEVANLDLGQTWLVTLSACETGVGEARSGEGVFGLRRAFMMSGAEYLLMTLWPVADDTTAQIMADFYKEALKSGDATAALSEVQRRWLVKLRGEKGLGTAVRDAGAFAMVQMANPRKKQAAIQRVANPSVEPQQQSTIEQSSDIPSNAAMDGPRVLSFEEAARRADAGEAYAQAILGTYYTYGYKVEKDEKKALEYLLKSAAQNHPLGIRSIGHRRLNGQGMEKNEQQGLKLIRDAFDGLNNMEGDPYALHALASDVLKATMQKVKSGDSKGVSQQMDECLRLYQVAADKGYAPSQTMLAALLDTTTPESDPERPKRLQKARELLLKALAQNFQEAIETWKEVFPKESVPNPPSTSEKTNNPQTP